MPTLFSSGFDLYQHGIRNRELEIFEAYWRELVAADTEFFSGSKWEFDEKPVSLEEVGMKEPTLENGWALVNGRMVKND